jgi:hypothetical protein
MFIGPFGRRCAVFPLHPLSLCWGEDCGDGSSGCLSR